MKFVIFGILNLIALSVLATSTLPLVEFSESGHAIINDEGGMPRILINKESPEKGVLLTWDDSNHFEREIFAQKVDLVDLDFNNFKLNHWKEVVRKAPKIFSRFRRKMKVLKDELNTKWVLSSEKQESIPIELTTRAKIALEQVRYGASTFRAEHSVEEFIRINNISLEDYTVQFNRLLTQKYGAGFSGAVYGLLVRSDRRTQATLKEVMELFANRKEGHGKPIAEVTRGIKILTAKGYLQTLSLDHTADPESMDALIQNLKATKMDIEVLPTKTGDSVEINARLIAEDLKKRLENGERVILFGVSKSVPEVLGAVAILNESGFLKDKNRNRGEIIGILLGSGVIGGTFLADQLVKKNSFLFARVLLGYLANRSKVTVDNFREGLNSLTSGYMEKYMERILPHIPSNLNIFNFVGINESRTGYALNSEVKAVQKLLMKRLFSFAGSNDGLVEYPGLGVMHVLGSQSRTIPFNSDHSILPGTLEGVSFKDPVNRTAGMESIFEMIINEASGQVLCKRLFQ